MGEIWKSVLAYFVVIIIAATGISITWANVNVVSANHYLEEVSTVIRESNYSEDIVAECIQEAKKNGYGLDIQIFGSSMGGRKGYAIITMEYPYELSVLGISGQKQTRKIV